MPTGLAFTYYSARQSGSMKCQKCERDSLVVAVVIEKYFWYPCEPGCEIVYGPEEIGVRASIWSNAFIVGPGAPGGGVRLPWERAEMVKE